MFCKSFESFERLIAAASGVCLLLGPGAASFAQEADDDTIEEIITIGTPGGGGVERQQASFALTTMNPDDIAKFSPKSTADLLKSVPGVWAESSGGVAGANMCRHARRRCAGAGHADRRSADGDRCRQQVGEGSSHLTSLLVRSPLRRRVTGALVEQRFRAKNPLPGSFNFCGVEPLRSTR
jgi:hypothetical protein